MLGLTKVERKELRDGGKKHYSHAMVAAGYQKEWIPKLLLDVTKCKCDDHEVSVAIQRLNKTRNPTCFIDRSVEVDNWRSAIRSLSKGRPLASTKSRVSATNSTAHHESLDQ